MFIYGTKFFPIMSQRNVQQSGNAFYIYLPSAWCKVNGITPKTPVEVDQTSDGNLVISPKSKKTPERHLTLKIGKEFNSTVNKFIVASYLNPVNSFKIQLESQISTPDILDQKRLLGGIEVVEFGDDQITCESYISISDPDMLVKTMLKKMTNMISIMMKENNSELIARYEEEIDRSNVLVTKSAISSLMFNSGNKLRHIDLFYLSFISKNLEGVADHLITLKKTDILKDLSEIITLLGKTLDDLSPKSAMIFSKKVIDFNEVLDKKSSTYRPLRTNLTHISEIIIDWSITNQIDS